MPPLDSLRYIYIIIHEIKIIYANHLEYTDKITDFVSLSQCAITPREGQLKYI